VPDYPVWELNARSTVTLSGDYIVAEKRDDGSAVVRQDTSIEASVIAAVRRPAT